MAKVTTPSFAGAKVAKDDGKFWSAEIYDWSSLLREQM